MQERLNQIFEQKGLTAAKFATLIGVNASTISHILAGRNKPGFDMIYNIAKAFPDISLSWLITGEGSMYTHLEPVQNNIPPTLALETPASLEIQTTPDTALGGSSKERLIKRVILIFDDGSFEEYQK